MSIILVLLLASTIASGHKIDPSLHRERDTDGAFAARGDDHSTPSSGDAAPHQHNADFDHESILGSSRDAAEFDQLPVAEAKKRLQLLLEKMDLDRDGNVDTREMRTWILHSFGLLSKEESTERFDEADEDGNALVTWGEHVRETYGMDDLAADAGDDDTNRMMREDRELFQAADEDGDGQLNEEEFLAFSHPEEDERMVPLLLQHTLTEKDKDQDGRLSFAEYIRGQLGEEHDEASLVTEKERFDEDYDKNLDGFLDQVEIRHWLVPDNEETATIEVQHLFSSADDDGDGILSFEEILDRHDLFVGSEVTDYGEHLHNMDRFEDEL